MFTWIGRLKESEPGMLYKDEDDMGCDVQPEDIDGTYCFKSGKHKMHLHAVFNVIFTPCAYLFLLQNDQYIVINNSVGVQIRSVG